MSGSNTWPLQALGPLCTKVGSGSTPRGGESVYQDEGVAFVRSQNVHNGLFHDEGLAFIGEEAAHKLRGVTVQSSDVLLNITGDSVARCCMIPEARLPARVSQHVAIIRPRSEFLRPRFLMYYLTSPFMQATLLSIAGSGGTRKAITKSHIEKLKVPLPSPEVQDSILNELSAYDDLIENNRKRIKLLERAARLLYTEWFVRGRFPGHQGVKVKDGVPQGWEKSNFGRLVAQVKVSVKPEEVDADTPYIGLEHIPRRALVLNAWGTAEQVTSNKFAFQEDDILFGKIRPYFHKVGFAITNGITSSDAIVMRTSEPDLYALALSVVSSDHFIAVASKSAKEGSKMPRADWKQMQAYPVLIPDTRTLSKFNETLHPMLNMMKVLAKQNIQLTRARDLLLPRLMSGKVKV